MSNKYINLYMGDVTEGGSDGIPISTDNTEGTICEDVTAGVGLDEESEIIIDEDSTYEEIITPIDDELPTEIIEEDIPEDIETIDETIEEEIETDIIIEEILPEAESPKTGNPSIALALIPIACAATAIIAK